MEKFVLNDTQMFAFFDELANDASESKLQEYLMNPKEGHLIFDVASKIDLGEFYKSLLMMYSSEDAMEQVLLVDNLQKVFRKSICIDGLERLLALNYTDIEWSMFLEYDFNKQQSRHYRDHFFHQFRDAYMALQLIENCNVIDNMKDWLKSGDRLIARYILSMCKKQEREESVDDQHFELGIEIMVKSVLISAIFHDLGYPLSYYMRVTNQIQQSLPYYSSICCAEKSNFQQLNQPKPFDQFSIYFHPSSTIFSFSIQHNS